MAATGTTAGRRPIDRAGGVHAVRRRARLFVVAALMPVVAVAGCSGDTADSGQSVAASPGDATTGSGAPTNAESVATTGESTNGSANGSTGTESTGTESTGTESTGTESTGPTPTVGTLMTQAMANARAAKSVRVIGRLLVGGRSSAVQAEGQPNGPNQRLIMSGRAWGTFEARVVASAWYLKGDKAFYTASKNPNADALAGKWVRLTSAQAASMAGSTVGGLLNVLLGNKDLQSLATTDLPAQVVTHEGRGAYSIGRQLTTDGSEIIISGTAPHQFLELRSGPKEGVRLVFTLWNAVPPVAAPPANEIITP